MIILRLDKNGGINKGDIKAFEHDNKSETYIIQLYKNNKVYDLTNKTVELTIVEKKRKYGDVVTLPVEAAAEGKVKLEIVAALTKQDGTYDFKLTVKDTAGLIETFPNFQVKIDTDITKNIAGEIAEDKNFTIITEGLKALGEYEVYKTNAKKVPDIEKKVTNLGSQLDTIPKLNYQNTSILNLQDRFEGVEINVKDFGAKGDGITDDTKAINDAILYSFTKSSPLVFPSGKYLVKDTLLLQRVNYIKGGNSIVDGYMNQVDSTRKVEIICESETLFSKGVNLSITITLEGIMFKTTNANCTAFKNINLYASRIKNNTFLGFNTIFDCLINQVSIIEKNNFLGITGYFIRNLTNPSDSRLTDSYIINNYINGKPTSNATLLDCDFISTSIISGNYIDFFKYGFIFKNGGIVGVNINNNIFDFIFKCFYGELGLSGLQINNNLFFHCSKKYVSFFPNATQDMIDEEWKVISCKYPGLNTMAITNNNVREVDIFLNLAGTCPPYDLKVVGNVYQATNKRVYTNNSMLASGTSYHGKNNIIDDIMYKKYTTLPDARFTGHNSIECLDNQIILYNDKPIININGIWKDFMGNTIT